MEAGPASPWGFKPSRITSLNSKTYTHFLSLGVSWKNSRLLTHRRAEALSQPVSRNTFAPSPVSLSPADVSMDLGLLMTGGRCFLSDYHYAACPSSGSVSGSNPPSSIPTAPEAPSKGSSWESFWL